MKLQEQFCKAFTDYFMQGGCDFWHETNAPEGSAGDWSWTQDGNVVAASAFIESAPHGRHWLAIRPDADKP